MVHPLRRVAVLATAALIGTGCSSSGGDLSVHEAYASHQAAVSSRAPDASSPTRAAAPVAAAPPTTVAVPHSEPVTVTRVKDGDTFMIAGNREVRVLGIDSCEARTDAGRRATETARAAFGDSGNQPVTLTREPGVDRDRYGRELRYVQLNGTDFGRLMVAASHTGVYEGRNDAAPAYLAELRAIDGGRTCSDPVVSTPGPDRDTYVHVEDDDGGESRFCGRRWWC